MAQTRWYELWAGPSLDEQTRTAMAERIVRWLLVPLWLILALGIASVLVTVGLSEPTRFVPPAFFFAFSLVVFYQAKKQRWLAAAAALSCVCTVTIAMSALINSVHAPLYRTGVLLVWLVVPLFGTRWGMATVAVLVLAGAAWFGLDALGLATRVQSPPATLVYAGYVLHLLISVALVSVPQRLLIESLREAKRKRQDAEDARSAAAASELALDAVFDQSSVALALLSANGQIVRLNARAARLFGASDAATLLGLGLPSVVAWSDDQRQQLTEAIGQAATGLSSRHELVLPRPDEKPGDFHVTVSPFHTENGQMRGVIVEAVDVSALIEAQAMLAQARRLESLGKLSGGVAHDINNMLGAIGGACELIRTDLRRRDTEAVLEDTTLIQSSVLRAASLTKQLLAFGRQDRFNSEQIDVHRLVADVARLLQRTLHKNVEIVHVVRDAPAHVRGDAAALEHALLNLALNAQDAMPNGGTITLTTECVSLDTARCATLPWEAGPGLAVLISVTDTGTGMSAEVKERAFDPFFTTKSIAKGTGLGLSAVHGTVLSHSGSIAVLSHEGIGTTFEIYLPALQVTTETAREVTSPPPATPLLQARVLFADDEQLVRQAVARILESLGCQVQAVDSGEALMDALAQGAQPDLIVTDLAMPGLAGMKLVQTLELHYPDLPLLLITGFTGDDVATALPARKLRKLLRKPFERSELGHMLRELLHERDVYAMSDRVQIA